MKNEKGITLIALVFTIIVLMLLASIAVYSGVTSLRYARYNKAKSEIEIMQATVNSWYKELEQGKNSVLTYGEDITSITTDENRRLVTKTAAATGISFEGENNNYRFFSEEYIKEEFGLNASFDFLISVKDRTVVLFGGLTYNGTTYFTIDQFGILNVDYNGANHLTFIATSEGKNIIIYNIQRLHFDNQNSPLSKFIVQYQKVSETTEWKDVTKKVTKYVENVNGEEVVKYKFPIEDYGYYRVKVLTTDKKEEEIAITEVKKPRAIFQIGKNVNEKMKQLAGNTVIGYDREDLKIIKIQRSATIQNSNKTDNNIVSTDDSTTPIYMWYDESGINAGTIWYYTEDDDPELNNDSAYLFKELRNLKSIELSNLDTSNVTTMKEMFDHCEKIENLDLSGFNTSNVTDMRSMFGICYKLKSLDLSTFNTSKLEYLGGDQTFTSSSSIGENQGMFVMCTELESINLSGWDTKKVISLNGLFAHCWALTTIDISDFSITNVENTSGMFYDCKNLTTIYAKGNYNTTLNTNSNFMFYGCIKLVGGASTGYDSSHVDATYAHIDGGISNPGYFTTKP